MGLRVRYDDQLMCPWGCGVMVTNGWPQEVVNVCHKCGKEWGVMTVPGGRRWTYQVRSPPKAPVSQ